MKKILAILVLVLPPCVAWADFTMPIDSVNAPWSTTVSVQATASLLGTATDPATGLHLTIQGMSVPISFSFGQSPLTFNFPASQSPQTVYGLRIDPILVGGKGWSMPIGPRMDIPFPVPDSLPANRSYTVIHTGPLLGSGTLTGQVGLDIAPPSAPTSLTATVAGAANINLAWGPSFDDTAVTAYLLERCEGAGCSNFAALASTIVATTFADGGLTLGTSYSYRVKATDASSNASPYSNVATAITAVVAPPPSGLSPDGSTAVPPSGTLLTAAGTWSFGTGTGGGGVVLLLNGRQAGGGYGAKLYVLNLGKIYTLNTTNNWYLWGGTSWSQVAAPTATP